MMGKTFLIAVTAVLVYAGAVALYLAHTIDTTDLDTNPQHNPMVVIP